MIALAGLIFLGAGLERLTCAAVKKAGQFFIVNSAEHVMHGLTDFRLIQPVLVGPRPDRIVDINALLGPVGLIFLDRLHHRRMLGSNRPESRR